MKKSKYVLFLTLSVLFFIGCSKSTQITGDAGPAGASGPPGGNLVYNIQYTTLNSTDLHGSGHLYHCYIQYPNYNKNKTYMISGYATKVPLVDTIKYPEWYKMPYTNVYATGDELYCSIGNDTITVWYYNSGSNNFPADSSISCKFIILPH